MPLTLEKYAESLDNRDEPRPAGPEPVPFARAKPHLPKLAPIKCVVWSGYGTLMLIAGGQPHLLNPDSVMRNIALDKTIQEFRMWGSMSRKPGEPSEYMASMIRQVADRRVSLSSKDGEFRFDYVWRGILDRLFQKEYIYDRGTYGEPDDYSQKICYYYLLRSQGVSVFPGALSTLRGIAKTGIVQAIHADGQCNAPPQLWRTLCTQGKLAGLGELFNYDLQLWSFDTGVKKASERSFKLLLGALQEKGIAANQCLYVGSSVERDIGPAKRRGFKTALLIADSQSAKVAPEQLKSPATRPDALLTEFSQTLKTLG